MKGKQSMKVEDPRPGRTAVGESSGCICAQAWKRQPTPVFLPGESQGPGSLVGCCLWGCTESGMTEVTQQQQQQQQQCIYMDLETMVLMNLFAGQE